MALDDRFADADEPDHPSIPDALPVDSPPSTPAAPLTNGRPVVAEALPPRIDEVGLDAGEDEYWQAEDDDEFDEDEDDDDDGFLERELDEVNDQDWENLAGDLTKRYNRMRQTVVASHASKDSSPSGPSIRPQGVIPAANRRPPPAQAPAATAATPSAATDAPVAGPSRSIRPDKVTDQLALLSSRFSDRLHLADLSSTSTRKGGADRINHRDRSDRATNEQVLDPRTRLVLFKMLGRGLVDRIEGCVSTGKEANVYHAVTENHPRTGGKGSLALKIYKTSILVFKDRDRYVTGEFRFRSGYARSNPRKMVRLWAEKELRNLRRLEERGVRCPRAVEVRANVLVMEFLGADEEEGGWRASPRLKDAELPPGEEALERLYWELVATVRIIYQQCKLVHADLSEYNILYHDSHLYIIDVSQSVEHDHPSAFDFLRTDLTNVDEFFARRGVRTLGLKRSFDFVTGREKIGGETEGELMEEVKRRVGSRNAALDDAALEAPKVIPDDPFANGAPSEAKEAAPLINGNASSADDEDDAVFRQAYIPRTLNEVYDPERDVAKVLKGEGDDLIYAGITGLAQPRPTAYTAPSNEEIVLQDGPKGEANADEGEVRFAKGTKKFDGSEDEDSEGVETGPSSSSPSGSEDEDEDEDEEVGGEKDEPTRPRGFKFEDKEDKKARKKAVKEEQREKRQNKMPKSVKKRKVAKTSGKSGKR